MNTILEQINSAGGTFVEFALPMLIQSGVLIVILLLVDLLLRKKVKAVFRYWIWMLVLVKLVLPTSLSSPLSLGYFFGDKLTYQDLAQAPPTQELIEPAPADISPVIDPLYIQPNPYILSEVPITPMVAPVVAEPVSPPEVPVTPLSWQGVVFLVWLAVVIAMGLLLFQRALFVRGLVAQSKESGRLMNDALAYCCASMGIKSKVGLKVLPNATTPSVCGLIRPVILLPQNLASTLGASRLRAVLMHELVHIKRCDLWVNLAQTVLQIIYFYNPLLWLANCVIRRIREQAVDETVLVAMGEKARQYPQTLVDVAKLSFKRPALSLRLIGVVESKSALAGRIKHILGRPMPRSARLGIVGVLAVIISGAILLPMAAGKDEEGAAEDIAKASEFMATLPNGVTVELVGICGHPSEGKKWWRPDGSLLEEKPYGTIKGDRVFADADERAYEFVVRLAGPTDVGVKWEAAPNGGSRMTSFPNGSDGILLPDLRVLVTKFHRRTDRALLRIGVTPRVPGGDAIQDYEWIEFKNVSLQPGVKTDVQIKTENKIQAPPLKDFERKLIEQVLDLVKQVEKKYPDQATHWPAGPGLYHVDAQGHVTVWHYQLLWHRSTDCAEDEVGWGSSQLASAKGMYYLPDGTPLQSRWSERGGGMKDIRIKIGRTVGKDERVPVIHRHRLPSDHDLLSRDGRKRKIEFTSWEKLPVAIIVRIDKPVRLGSRWLGEASHIHHYEDYDQLFAMAPPPVDYQPMYVFFMCPEDEDHMLDDTAKTSLLPGLKTDVQVEGEPVDTYADNPRAAISAIIEQLKSAKYVHSGKGSAHVVEVQSSSSNQSSTRTEKMLDFIFEGELSRSDAFTFEKGKRGDFECRWAVGPMSSVRYNADEKATVQARPFSRFHRRLGYDFHPETFPRMHQSSIVELLEGVVKQPQLTLKVTQESKDVVRVVSEYKNETSEENIMLLINGADGMRLSSWEYTAKDSTDDGTGARRSSLRLKWRKYAGLWYISEAISEGAGVHNGLRSEGRTTVTIREFTPNVEIEDKEFTLDGLDIRPGARVNDLTLDTTYKYAGSKGDAADKLRKLSRAAKMYANDYDYKFPDTMQQLKQFLDEKELKWLSENVFYLGKGRTVVDPPEIPLAYDKTMFEAEHGKGTNVLFVSGIVSFRVREQLKKLGITAGPKPDVQVEVEGEGERSERAWGEAVEGIQMRVRPERQAWYEGETPKFLVDMRNKGTVEWELGLTQEHWEVELDGLWHRVGASFSGWFQTLLLVPGQEHKDIEFYPGVWSRWNINGRPLKFTPGSHTVRLSFGPSTRDRANWRRLRAVSNAVVIEVLPAEADKRDWGEAVAGLQCGLRADKRLWKADETPKLQAVARNVGERPWPLPRPSELFYLKVAGKIWRWKGPVSDRPADLEPREALDKTTILLSEDWVGAYDSDLRLKLSPGRHTVQLVMFVSDPVPPEAVPGTIPVPKQLRIESNVVVIEVLPTGERPGTVDDEGDAATTLQAELYELWQERQDLAGAETFGKRLLEKYTEREEKSLVYYQLAEIYAQSGQADPNKIVEFARQGWWHLNDPVKKARLFVYWGDALQLTKGREEAARIYLRGLRFCLQFGLPKDKPERPTVGAYTVDGRPEVVKEYRRGNQLEMAAWKHATRIEELIELRQALTEQVVQLYAREPDAFDELHALSMKYLGSGQAAQQLIAVAKAYRTNPEVAIPVITSIGGDPNPDADLLWGQAAEGIRVRLRAEKAKWAAGETPKFKADVRNDGSHRLLLTSAPDYWGVEVDGVWYRVTIPMLGGAKGMSFGPDKRWYNLELSLDMALGGRSEKGGVKLAPGRHTIRVILANARSGDSVMIPIGAVSEPVEIVILPVDSDMQVDAEGAGEKVSKFIGADLLWSQAADNRIPLEVEYPELPDLYDSYFGIGSVGRRVKLAEKSPLVLVPPDVTNVARGKAVTVTEAMLIMGDLEYITDGDKRPQYYVEFEPKTVPQHVTIDLGREYEIHAVVW
ncbi:MAG: M56 family metallopeptidase [Planctomycetes bacterium]|nr:M56 family metallopeptidase [Planctomycetota bacterium]